MRWFLLTDPTQKCLPTLRIVGLERLYSFGENLTFFVRTASGSAFAEVYTPAYHAHSRHCYNKTGESPETSKKTYQEDEKNPAGGAKTSHAASLGMMAWTHSGHIIIVPK